MIDYDKYKGRTEGEWKWIDCSVGGYWISVVGIPSRAIARVERVGDAVLFADAPALLNRCLELEALLAEDKENFATGVEQGIDIGKQREKELEDEKAMLLDALEYAQPLVNAMNVPAVSNIVSQALNKAKGGK